MAMRYKLIGFVTGLVMASFALGQGPPIPPPPFPVVRATVTTGAVKPLGWSTQAVNPYIEGAPPGTYFVEFDCKAERDPLPEGWTFDHYYWTPVEPFPDGTAPSMFQLTFEINSPPTPTEPAKAKGESLKGRAYTAAIHTATVHMVVYDVYDILHEYVDTVDVAPIGGGLALSVYDRELNTYSHDAGNPLKPAYVQYLGHSSKPSLPTLAQRPQKGRFVPALGQPAGTTFVNSLTGAWEDFFSFGGRLDFGALSGSTAGGMDPSIYFSLNIPGLGSGAGNDCSDTMPSREQYKFTSHEPHKVIATLYQEYADNQGGYFAWKRLDKLHLQDGAGDPMPGVYIQERFTPEEPLPPFFDTSTVIELWQTKMNPAGDANGYDVFRFPFPSVHSKSIYPNSPLNWLHQEYWAGTRDNTWGVTTSGIRVGTWEIKYWTDAIDHYEVTDN